MKEKEKKMDKMYPTPIHDRWMLDERRRELRDATDRQRRAAQLVSFGFLAVVGVGLLVWQLTQPDPVDGLIIGGLALVVPLLASYRIWL
jgi:hypothetical protein